MVTKSSKEALGMGGSDAQLPMYRLEVSLTFPEGQKIKGKARQGRVYIPCSSK